MFIVVYFAQKNIVKNKKRRILVQDLQELITQQPYTRLITPKRIVLAILGVIVLACLATSFLYGGSRRNGGCADVR